jgi:hypothetical protein
MLWLGEKRGYATDWVTQRWVEATGRRVQLAESPWLAGPVGDTRSIGGDCFRDIAAREGLAFQDGPAVRGLLPDFSVLDGPRLSTSAIASPVRHFYERTAAYELDAWAEWCGAFRPFGWLLAVLFSRRLQQLNVPLSGLDTSRGLSNSVWHLVDPASGAPRYVVWLRHLVGSGETLYAGSYGPVRIPGWDGPCLKVVFPLPNGNALVIMKPSALQDGSLHLASEGRRFGDPGFYFTVREGDGTLAVRYVRTMQETIRVYESGAGEARADHTLRIWGLTFLRLHYRLRPTGP